MRCLVCDAEMDLVEVVPDDTMPVPGYEHNTFRCPQCGDEERRLLFARADETRAAEPEPSASKPEPSASKPPAWQPDEPVLSAAAMAELESQLAGVVSAAAPVEPARSRPSFWAWLGKLVTAIRSLPAAASRRGNASIREAPPPSAPVFDQPLSSPAAPPALEPAAVAPISSVAEPPGADPPEPAPGSSDPDAVVAALAAIAELAPQPAEPASPLGAEPEVPEPVASAPAPTAWGPLPDKAQASSSAPPASPSEPAAPSAPLARAPEPVSTPPLPVASKPEAEEDLLRRAIEILDGPTPAAPPASAAPPQPAAAAQPPTPRADEVIHAKLAKKSLLSRAVRVERAPDDATMYLAKDIASGRTVMSHPDTAHLREMCGRIGWEVVEE